MLSTVRLTLRSRTHGPPQWRLGAGCDKPVQVSDLSQALYKDSNPCNTGVWGSYGIYAPSVAIPNYSLAAAPAGTVMVTPEWSDWRDGWWWWIQSVYVAPAHRRKGVFRALFDHVQQLASATDGVRGLRLYVERDNVGAQRTYEFVGMKDAGYRMFEMEFPR